MNDLLGVPVTGLSLALLFCPLLGACASDAAMQKRVESLQQEVDRVQSRADRLEERLTALEVGQQKSGTVHVDEEGGVSVRGRPDLKVVKVSPESDAAQAKQPRPADIEEEKDQGPRPVIRATGSGEGSIDNLEAADDRSKPSRDARPKRPEGGF